jgi:excisionase family DNA binding protein
MVNHDVAEETPPLKLFSVNRAAHLADVHRSTILRLIAQGDLDAVRFGQRGKKVTEESFRRYIARRRI